MISGLAKQMNGSTYNQLRIFHTIVREGSISGAARVLTMATPSVSQALKTLEHELRLPLFTRTTRKIELTEAGELLYQRTLASVQELSLAVESVSDLSQVPRGKVRLTAPRFVFQQLLAPIYAEFCRQYPEIELEISINDATVDIIEQGFDLGIRFGHKVAEGMIARPLTLPAQDALFASPDYIAQYGVPESIEALETHKLIYYRFITANQLLPLTLADNGKEISVEMKPALIVNDTDLMKDAAKQGLGIGRLLIPIVEDELNTGELVPILEQYWPTMPGLYMYFHQNTQKAKRVRALIDFLVEHAGY